MPAMASYDDLSSLTGKLKRAAIDAYMKDQGFTIVEGESKYYDERHSVSDLHYWVSRPGDDGNGGGDWTSDHFLPDSWIGGGKDEEFQGHFDTIRERVDSALRKWQDLPIPSEFDPLLDSMRAANVALGVVPSKDGGTVTGTGFIGPNLTLIETNCEYMSGGIITAFKTKFLLSLGNCIAGHHGITVVLGEALASEKAMWEKARQDVANAVEAATTALDSYVKSGNADWTLTFGVLGAIITGAAAFVSGGATVALSGAGAGVTLLKEVNDAKDREAAQPDQSFEGIMTAYEQVLTDLNGTIKTAEQALDNNFTTNIGHIGPESGFDLDAPLKDVDDDSDLHLEGSPTIIHDKSLIFEITGTAMPAVADEVVKAQGHLDVASDSGPFSRDAAVGLGYNGCFNNWSSLLWLSWRLLADLEWEIRAGAKTLELAIEDMGQVDTDAADALEQHAASIADGSGMTPYDTPLPPQLR
jgi:hypothetical protein